MIRETFSLYLKLIKYLHDTTKNKVIHFLIFAAVGSLFDLLNFAFLSDAIKLLRDPDNTSLSFFRAINLVSPQLSTDSKIKIFSLFFVGIIVIRYMISQKNLLLSSVLGNNVNNDLVNALFSKYINLKFLDFYKHSSSIYFVRLTSDINIIGTGFQNVLLLILEMFTLIVIFSFFLITQFAITLLIILVLFIIGIFYLNTVSKKIKQLSKDKVLYEQEKYRTLDQSLKSYVEITIFGMQSASQKILNKWNKLLVQANAEQNYLNNIPRIVIENLLFFVFALYVFLQKFNIIGGSFFLAGSVFLIAILRVTPSLYRAIILMSSSANPNESLRLVHEALNLIPEQEEINTREEKESVGIGQLCDIRIQGLNFSFVNNKGNLKVIFDGLTCQITAPGMYGITGKSGSGKSTLLELIIGFRHCTNDEECVYVNGIPLNMISPRMWYKKISYIPQNSTFFEGSILENICVNFDDTKANVDLEKVNEIIKLVKLTEVINQFDLKLNHRLEQNARNISGGQRQRLALARALYKSPELLILDESTNALDSETEAVIFEVLEKISEQVLIIFVAHNKNVYKHCKGIIDLNN